MKNKSIYTVAAFFILVCLIDPSATAQPSRPGSPLVRRYLAQPPDTGLRFPIKKREPFLYPSEESTSPLFLRDPSNIESEITYDPETNSFIYQEKIGDRPIGPPAIMSLEEYREYEMRRSKRDYWQQRSRGESLETQASFMPQINIGGEAFDRVFGSNTIDIIPQGSAELIFGFNINRIDNPTLSERLRRTPSFTFEEKIQMNVNGSIGDKMKLGINYNTEATFDFENKTKLEYAGKEDEIIKKIEAGNVTLPLSGSLITGSQSLFGLKTELQFGKLRVTSIFSQQKGETSTIRVEGGAQLNEFEVRVDEYDANKHFFLSQYFRDNYNRALSNLPIIQSGVTITKIEVWVTNKTSNFENSRNIVGFMDLAESSANIYNSTVSSQVESGIFPRNSLNDLYDQMINNYPGIRNIANVTSVLQPLNSVNFTSGQDYEKIENARLLNPREYTLNPQLGFISLNAALNADEVLAVAFEYTLNGQTYKVGELSSDINAPEALVVKLLKGTNLTPRLPTWNLMMKNIYAIGAFQVNKEDFYLEILYQDDQTGASINYIPEEGIQKKTLLQILNLDNLNEQLDPQRDGVFDYIPGVTILPSNGRVVFPVLEPFGDYLAQKIGDPDVASKYTFTELYDSTQTLAKQIAEKNKFKLMGTYKSSSSSEIMLNAMNIPQGSVKVTAGGMQLTENVDYTVDYTLGRVTIINQGLLESGTPINISLENQSLFAIQTKTLVGSHLEYRISDDFNIGGTILNLTERPLTQKVNIGDEPISNTIWGLNGSYRTESQFLTTMIDRLPFIETKEPSNITVTGEFAHLIPGHSRAIEKEGIAYIDDFEGSQTSIDLKSFPAWVLSSCPSRFPESNRSNDLGYGYKRGKLAWYVIDPLFLRNNSLTPGHLKANPDLQSSHFVEEVFETDIFPNKENPSGIPSNINVLNVAFYPKERGPYNYTTDMDSTGALLNSEEKWGGIMREIVTNDFESANVEFIEFWLMDPFVEEVSQDGGKLYFNLGNVSEDILKDSRKSFENGLPISPADTQFATTAWGRVPVVQSLVNAFNNDPTARQYQDVGLDGLPDPLEIIHFNDFIQNIEAQFGTESTAYRKATEDPSSDNFHYFRGSDYDRQGVGILDRYKQYNGMEGNSPTSEQSDEPYPTTGSTLPDVEDINRDNTLSEGEAYFEYEIDISPEDLQVGNNFITDKVVVDSDFPNGEKSSVTWYQFRVPLSDYDASVGPIQDFKSIRFFRMYMTGFQDSVLLRFARLELVRGEWRKYNLPFVEGGESLSSPEPPEGSFDISAVNIEENAGKDPVNYVLPPTIDRVIDPTNPQLRQLNEQAIVLKVLELADGDARAAYKNIDLDVRQYRKLEMFVHAEAIEGCGTLEDGELTAFIRLGSDYTSNYYEYEIPLKLTAPGNYENESSADRLLVWPKENKFEIVLDDLLDVKLARNNAVRTEGSEVSLTAPFSIIDDRGNRVSVRGNPNLSNVRTIMIGVRNPKARNGAFDDDGLAKCGEIWMNELRLTDFREQGGWAANGRVTTKLADFGTLTLSGNTSQPGFGSIETGVNERSKEERYQYDISANLNLGKFFAEKSGVVIPVYAGYSTTIINPQYNPLDPDIELRDALRAANSDAEKDSIKSFAQDLTQRRSINFTNVRKNKLEGKPNFYDLANWSVSYSFNDINARNIHTEYDYQKRYRAAVSYTFNTRPKNVTPFSKIGFLSSPAFKLIRDFNFYYAPSRISFRTDINRFYNERLLRNLRNLGDSRIRPDTLVNKDFYWNRYFDLQYDLTRSIKFDFSSTNIARIDEPIGPMNPDRPDYEVKRDSIWQEFLYLGRTTSYSHRFNVAYTLPINKIPLFNWITATTRYNGTYNWDAGPITADTIDLGNTIQNSSSLMATGQLNMTNFYNKVGFLKRINDKYRARGRGGQQQSQARTREVTWEDPRTLFRANRPKNFTHKLKTEDVTVTVTGPDNQTIESDVEVVNENRVRITVQEDVRNASVRIVGRRQVGQNPLIFIAENTARLLMGTKNISVSYTINKGSVVPGYKPAANFMGMNHATNGVSAPGWAFVAGLQEDDFIDMANSRGWISSDSLIVAPHVTTYSNNLNARGTFEPFNGFRIDITAKRTFMESSNQYAFNRDFGDMASNRQISGNFSISTISMGTAFESVYSDGDFSSEAFDRFKDENRFIISRRLAENRSVRGDYQPSVDTTGFYTHYGGNSSQVMIPAFLAAYTGQNVEKVTLEPFPSFKHMLPNWRLTFDGLSRVDLVKKIFRTINISHTYRSTYNIGSYLSNPFYSETPDGFVSLDAINELSNNFHPEFEISSVSIQEQFSPLINIDATTVNNINARFEIKKSRQIALSIPSAQITEISSNEFIIGTGYRFEEVPLIINTGGGQRSLDSDLNIRVDFSIRDNRTVIRKLAEDIDQITAGQRILKINTSLDYVLSDRFNLRFFFDRIVNKPFVSISYPTANTNVGFSLRFTLAQ